MTNTTCHVETGEDCKESIILPVLMMRKIKRYKRMQEMKLHREHFTFGRDFTEGNVVYCVAEGGTHSYEYCYKYIYNALPHFFMK